MTKFKNVAGGGNLLLRDAEQRHERSERRTRVNGNVEFSLQA